MLLGFEPQTVGDPAPLAQPHRDVGGVRFRGHGEAGADAPLVGVDEDPATALPHSAHHISPREAQPHVAARTTKQSRGWKNGPR